MAGISGNTVQIGRGDILEIEEQLAALEHAIGVLRTRVIEVLAGVEVTETEGRGDHSHECSASNTDSLAEAWAAPAATEDAQSDVAATVEYQDDVGGAAAAQTSVPDLDCDAGGVELVGENENGDQAHAQVNDAAVSADEAQTAGQVEANDVLVVADVEDVASQTLDADDAIIEETVACEAITTTIVVADVAVLEQGAETLAAEPAVIASRADEIEAGLVAADVPEGRMHDVDASQKDHETASVAEVIAGQQVARRRLPWIGYGAAIVLLSALVVGVVYEDLPAGFKLLS